METALEMDRDPEIENRIMAEGRASLYRLGLAVFAGVSYLLFLYPAGIAWLALTSALGAAAYATWLVLDRPYERYPELTGPAALSLADGGLIVVFLIATGGFDSVYYPLWYASILAVAIRYPTRTMIVTATGYTAAYAGLALVGGALVPQAADLVIRAAFIFAIGGLGAALSNVALEQAVAKNRYKAVANERQDLAARLRSILDATHDGVLVTGLDGRIVTYNERFQAIWGIPDHVLATEDDQTARAYVLDQLEDPAAFEQRVREVYPSDEPTKTELELADGRILHRYSHPLRIDGETQGRVWCFQDVTRIEQARTRLEESNEQLQQFADAVSHDVREPLRAITGHLTLLERSAPDRLTDDEVEHLGFAVDGATRLAGMVEGLLAYSRVETQGDSFTQVALRELVDQLQADLVQLIDDHDATLTVGPLPTVRGDPSQLRRVLQNLVENAIKYRGTQPPRIQITARPRDGMVEVAVADNGQGIPPDEQERIFDVFRRGTQTNGQEGLGMGLTLCQRIVDRHGGTISVDSAPGEGSTFRFTVPAAGDGGSHPGSGMIAVGDGNGPPG